MKKLEIVSYILIFAGTFIAAIGCLVGAVEVMIGFFK